MPCTHPKLGWQHSSSSSSSDPWLWPPNLDGPPNQPPTKLPVQRRPNAPDVVGSIRQPGRVADRIRAINSLQQLPSNIPAEPKKPDPPSMPQIYPLPGEVSRPASPFPRRDSAQSPARPQTPLSKSQPLMNPLVHCPMPKRYQPQLSANIEKGAIPDTFDQSMCYRHGRKLKPRKSMPAGMDKTFSGAYVPTGPSIRQQVDPLSPWAIGRRLAKTSGTTVSPDICPDCLAEEDIIKRESRIDAHAPQAPATHLIRSASSSVFTERGTPPESDQSSNVLVGTTLDNQTVKIPGATVSDLPPDKFGGIVATDLGNMIDAIIVEHSGSLGKVISNIRNGMPDSDWTQRLSRDLAKVSEAVASLPEDSIKHTTAFSRNINGRRSIILDASPDSLRKRAKTMPELLDLIDAATEEFGLTSSDSGKQEFNIDFQHMPGDFPHSPSTFPPQAITPFAVRHSAPSTPAASVSPFPSPQSLGPAPIPESPRTAYQAPGVEPPLPEADEDEATLVEPEIVLQSINKPPSRNQATIVPVEAPSTQQRSRIPKATTIPLTRSLHASLDTLRPSPARPKPSMVAKQQQQQRTFQQGWLREAAVAERSERRSRSKGAHRI